MIILQRPAPPIKEKARRKNSRRRHRTMGRMRMKRTGARRRRIVISILSRGFQVGIRAPLWIV